MADHLASIFGTEKDRVNCPFYFKIGSCRHGDRCSRLHNRPTISPTILLQNMYQNPVVNAPLGPDGLPMKVDERKAQKEFEEFYEDVFEELDQFGELENLNVCDNLADHMVGNVYVKFRDENCAAKAVAALQGRYYNGRPIVCEFSPVTDFRESTCRQYEENTCNRGGYCNFMHLKAISKDLRKVLWGRYKRRSSSRSRSRDRRRSRSRERSDRDRDRERGRDRYDDRGRSGHRDDRRGPGGGGYGGPPPRRETSAERREKIAAWNAQRQQAAPPPAGGGGYSGAAAGGYGGAPPSYGNAPPAYGGGGGGYGSSGAPPSYGAPPPAQGGYGGPPPSGGNYPPAPSQGNYGGPPPPSGGYPPAPSGNYGSGGYGR